MTADDLLTRFHKKQSLVDDLVSRCESRPHPDFPTMPEMKQYKVSGESKETFSSSSERTRALHWTAMLQGQVALEMAQNVESLFAIESSASSASTSGGGSEQAGKPPKAKGKGAAKQRAKKVATPADTRKVYIDQYASRCMEFISIMMEIRAKLGSDSWTAGLRQMLDGERASFEDLHGKLVAMGRTAYTDAELAPLVARYKEHACTAGQYIVAGDNMTNKKSRKLPVEPVAPKPTGANAVESSAPAA
jgi:hypothetical protein